mgnify:CR=1 FL=1
MWTVMWVEDGMDKWDRFETENDVRNLMEELKENSDVCEEDVWIFPPKADEYAMTGNMFFRNGGII